MPLSRPRQRATRQHRDADHPDTGRRRMKQAVEEARLKQEAVEAEEAKREFCRG
jgi:hypothetical protein